MVVMRRRFFCSILKIPTNHKSIANKINATITIGQKVQAQVSSCVADVGYLVSLMLNDPELNSINGIIPINEEKYIQQLYRRPLRSGEQIQCFVGKVQYSSSYCIIVLTQIKIKGSTVLLSTRPLLKERLPIIKKSILQLLSYMPDSQIQIGIKSSSDEITRYELSLNFSYIKGDSQNLVAQM